MIPGYEKKQEVNLDQTMKIRVDPIKVMMKTKLLITQLIKVIMMLMKTIVTNDWLNTVTGLKPVMGIKNNRNSTSFNPELR